MPVRLDGAPNARQAHGITKRVDQNDGKKRSRPQKEEVCVGSKEGGIRKLQNGAGNGSHQGRLRVGNAEFVKVVKVSKAKDNRRQEDDSADARPCHQEQWDSGGAE